jgi:hypothetical protein
MPTAPRKPLSPLAIALGLLAAVFSGIVIVSLVPYHPLLTAPVFLVVGTAVAAYTWVRAGATRR